MAVRTPEEIVEELASTPHPDVARDPDESLAVLERLTKEARQCVKNGRGRTAARTYFYEDAAFTRAMKRVDDAPASDVRACMKFVVDQLWGVGFGITKETTRRLRFDKDWQGFAILPTISRDIAERTFFPFKKPSR